MRCGDPQLQPLYTTPETLNHDVARKEIVKLLGRKDIISYLVYNGVNSSLKGGMDSDPTT